MIKNILSVLYKLFFRPNNEYLTAKQIQNYMLAEALLKKEFLEYEIVLDDYGDEEEVKREIINMGYFLKEENDD